MRSLPPAYIYAFPKYDPLHCATIKKTTPTTLECHKMTLTRFETDVLISYKRGRVLVKGIFLKRESYSCAVLLLLLFDDESGLDDYFPSSSGSETSEYDITSDEEDSDCDYSLKDA
ncbi:hypothetical protein NPIL_592901 [Nephila pilipes]|uniref:Uncharacterized protein n=1 Tax=Nephila pilipes TaxID=299642 RepID=A0A8X6IQ51_NEPPI|nr:hypothetical protein NPIL_592901 [Nephila pilipes]